MAIEAPQKVIQIPVIRKDKEIGLPPQGQRRPKQQKQKDEQRQDKNSVDIKV